MSQICELRSTQPRTIHCIFMYLITLHHASIRSQMYSSRLVAVFPPRSSSELDSSKKHIASALSWKKWKIFLCTVCTEKAALLVAIQLLQSNRSPARCRHSCLPNTSCANMKASKPLLQRQSSMCFGQMYGRPRSDQEDVRRVHYQRERNRKVAPPLKPLLRINTRWDICNANPFSIYIP